MEEGGAFHVRSAASKKPTAPVQPTRTEGYTVKVVHKVTRPGAAGTPNALVCLKRLLCNIFVLRDHIKNDSVCSVSNERLIG